MANNKFVFAIFLYLTSRWLATFHKKLREFCFIEFEDEMLEALEAQGSTCITTMILTKSLNRWSSLNTTICSDKGWMGLLSGAIWIISVEAMINKVRNRLVVSIRKLIEKLDFGKHRWCSKLVKDATPLCIHSLPSTTGSFCYSYRFIMWAKVCKIPLTVGITEKHIQEVHQLFDDKTTAADINMVVAWQSGHRPLQRVTTSTLDGAFPAQVQPA